MKRPLQGPPCLADSSQVPTSTLPGSTTTHPPPSPPHSQQGPAYTEKKNQYWESAPGFFHRSIRAQSDGLISLWLRPRGTPPRWHDGHAGQQGGEGRAAIVWPPHHRGRSAIKGTTTRLTAPSVLAISNLRTPDL
ncbi:unnamed protein product [Lota lota]